MSDRDVKVCITLKASQLADVRAWFEKASQFPDIVYTYANEFRKLLSKEEASPEDGAELARLVQDMSGDAMQASLLRSALRDVLQTAIMSDPEGRKGPLQ